MKTHLLEQLALAGMLCVAAPLAVEAQSVNETQGPQPIVTIQETAPQRGPNGGTLKQLGELQYETVVWQGGIKIFVCDQSGQPVSVERGRGAVSLRVDGIAKRYRYDLLPDGKGSLTAPINLSQIAGRQIQVDMQIVGVLGSGNRPLALSEVATVPVSEQQLAAAAIATRICHAPTQPKRTP